jgi:MoaA/NifB/PqqE/SkfB family radical SAM enzyme
MALPSIKVVQLTLTNRCQCNCRHCGVSKLRQAIKGELTMDQIEVLFQDLALAGCLVVDLFGGEPTLRDDLFEIIARGKSHGFMISLETNGYVIDQPYVDRLKKSRLDQIYLSIDDYRAEVHDEIRRRPGCFDRAVRALELGSRSGITMHVSTVPQAREFFLNGDINRFMEFVLAHGAEKVRLLLPRFVGDSIHENSGPFCAGEERELFSHVSDPYRDFIYLHTPGTPLGEKNVCTAKQVFCHVMANGWVAPCPYFPLVFGDVLREPIIDIFERIQSHPLVRLGGEFCPMRDENYINGHIRELGLDQPFFPITVANQVDLGSPCGAGCQDCIYGAATLPRPCSDVLDDLAGVAPEYTRVEFYGGDAFRRDDLCTILDSLPARQKAIIWSAFNREPWNSQIVERLVSYPIEAVKIHLSPSGVDERGDSDEKLRLDQALGGLKLLTSIGLPIHVYVPLTLFRRFQGLFAQAIPRLDIERFYVFERDMGRPVANPVACFGKGLANSRILWVKRRR